MTEARIPASGAQYVLEADGYRAEIASVGASVRSLSYQGRDLVVPFEADILRPSMRGALLVPWPNRISDGSYDFGGVRHQLPMNEAATGTASHGLVGWLHFDGVQLSARALRLSAVIEPRPGYPWRVSVDVVFAVSSDGLRQAVHVTNLSPAPAPVGIGGHPYLLAGEPGREAINEWWLHVPADEVFLISEDRMLPTALVSVAAHGGGFDFRQPRRIDDAVLNNPFTALIADDEGRVRVRVANDDGVGSEIEWGADAPWVQIYTSDASAGEAYRHGVAVEPMTCPPDAFTSGRDLRVLDEGESASLAWTIRALG